jgi:hypothetical protein
MATARAARHDAARISCAGTPPVVTRRPAGSLVRSEHGYYADVRPAWYQQAHQNPSRLGARSGAGCWAWRERGNWQDRIRQVRAKPYIRIGDSQERGAKTPDHRQRRLYVEHATRMALRTGERLV